MNVSNVHIEYWLAEFIENVLKTPIINLCTTVL